MATSVHESGSEEASSQSPKAAGPPQPAGSNGEEKARAHGPLREAVKSPILGGTLTGAAVVAAAALWGSLDAGALTVLALRLLRKRPPLSYTVKEGWGQLTDALLKRLGVAVVHPGSPASMALRTAEAGAAGYFMYRMIQKNREERAAKRRTRAEARP